MSSSHFCSVAFPAVLILELMITSFASCSAPGNETDKENFDLQKFVKSVLSKRATGILDQSIFCGEVGESMDKEGIWRDCGIDQAECLISVFEIGLICSAESPKDRKDMNGVAGDLLSIRDKFLKTGIHEDRIQSPAPRDRCEEVACSTSGFRVERGKL